jgi:hypothetical protein
VESGVLVGEPGAYSLAKALPTIQVPTTVHAVLAARIDRLPAEDKRLLQTAAVIGTEVPFPLLQAIADLPKTDLHRGLAHLQAAEFLYETRLFPEREYTFKHALTHEVAYGSLLQERRRALHARMVEAIGETLSDVPLQVAAQYYLVMACHLSGDYRGTERACRRLMQSLQGERTRERFGLATFPAVLCLAYLARTLAQRGVFDEGDAHGQEAIRMAEAVDHPCSLIRWPAQNRSAAHLNLPEVWITDDETRRAHLEFGDEPAARTLVPIGRDINTTVKLFERLEGEAREAKPGRLRLCFLSDGQTQAANWKQVGGRAEVKVKVGAACHCGVFCPIQPPAASSINRELDLNGLVLNPARHPSR